MIMSKAAKSEKANHVTACSGSKTIFRCYLCDSAFMNSYLGGLLDGRITKPFVLP